MIDTGLAIITGAVANLANNFMNEHSGLNPTKKERRLHELQRIRDLENQQFQAARDVANQKFQLARDAQQRQFQMEVEARRLSFQEHLELRRLQFQDKMENKREHFQKAMLELNMKNSREIAEFQAKAMRETQILVARENAQNMLQNQMVQEALKNFPLNISPLVLLNNRPHSLSALMRFTVEEQEEKIKEESQKLLKVDATDVIENVLNYTKNPEALNIFIAPVFVDSKIPYQKVLSTKIWETIYQKLESFFTENYSRSSERPVVFYPTAWNDKYTSGVHASETLHFFLKDLPCIVLEPKFDGSRFRMAISSWGLGYSSVEHNRAELNFDMNIDLAIARSVYERSQKAIATVKIILNTNISEADKRPYYLMEDTLQKNIDLYEALNLAELQPESPLLKNEKDKKIEQISALGIGNIFKVDSSQDLEPLANYFSAQIGMTLAMLSDIHHLRTTNIIPTFPKLIKDHFPILYKSKELREALYNSYRLELAGARKVIMSYATNKAEEKDIEDYWRNQIDDIGRVLELTAQDSLDEIQAKIIRYTKDHFNFSSTDFDEVWDEFLNNIGFNDLEFVRVIKDKLSAISEHRMERKLDRRIDTIETKRK